MADDERLPIRLRGQEFDPVHDTAPAGAADALRADAGETTRYLVQFHRPLTTADRGRLQSGFGLRLVDYIPELSYLERLDPRVRARLAADPTVRAVVAYDPALKVVPGIGETPFRTAARSDDAGLRLSVTLFADADPAPVVALAEQLGAQRVTVNDDRALGGSLVVVAEVPDRGAASAFAQLDEVRTVEEVAEHIEDNVNAAGTIQSGAANTPSIWNQGIHGEGQIIGIIDSGPLDINHCFFQDPVNNTPSVSHRKVLQIRNVAGTAAGGHATFTAGNAAGDDFNNPGTAGRRGGAWAARLVVGNNADIPGNASMLAELQAAAAMGASLHTNSWHDNTAGAGNPATYNQTSADVDAFCWNNEDHLVFGSAGNNGEEQGPPGTAKNAVCVGAAQADPNEMNFGDGNAGPTADGRRKPDLMAVGCGIQSATVSTPCGTGPRSACATSYATPHVAAAAALIRQYFTEGWYPTGAPEPHHAFVPSGALLKAMLITSTIDMTGIAGYPSTQEGWGLIQLANVLFFTGGARNVRVWDKRNADGLSTGDTEVLNVEVASNTQPLKVVLVWTDPPGAVNAATPTVNNLNLEVVSPDGTQTFLGNVFTNGVSSTGGTADTVNNVEVVLVNAPAPGQWTVRVVATAVNVGNPGQGYAIGVGADLTEGPANVGTQDTMLVRAMFSDVALEPSLPNLQNLMLDVADYVDQVSYGQANVVPAYRGPVALDNPKSYYYHPDRNLLIELAEEVVAKLVAVEPNVFDTVERLIIVTNDVNFTGDWATTGPWPYTLPGGFTRPISVSVQSYANLAARFAHGMLHQFGLVDLYAHPGVTFPRPYVDEWDNMAGTFNNVHPLIWSKQRAGWVTSHGNTIEYIPRPAPGGSYAGPNPIRLFRNTDTAANRKAIAIGLTQGAATLAAENVFYFVEARSAAAGTYDSSLPAGGVLVYYVNEVIPQGEGPVILRDKNLTTAGVSDAAFGVGDVITIPGTGITLTVLAGTGGADFDIQVAYTPPVTDHNVFITRGDTVAGDFIPWFSPDIWVDSPKNGFNLGGGPPPHAQRENPVAGMVNRIYARIHNAGPGTAFDFDVRFRISEPYHTVGGEADFDRFVGIKHIDSLGSSATQDVFVEWTPQTGVTPHACVLVDAINLVGTDTNPNDNSAQENLDIVTSVTSSPFHPVTYKYNLTNPYAEPALFYFRADGAPKNWDVQLVPRKIRLNAGERMTGEATITPPARAKVCTSHRITITSWTPRGDTLINVGGGIVQVDLRRPTVITMDADAGGCDERDLKRLLEEARKAGKKLDPKTLRQRCGRVTTRGCLDPPQAGVEVILRYVDPLGNVTYRTATTDANGCFEDLLVSATGGTWQVSAEYPGGKCESPAQADPVTVCWCRE